MDLFGMGIGEIVLILIVALIIWGPEKLPEIAGKLGGIMRALRKASADLTTVVTKELDMEENKRQSQPKLNSSEKSKQPSDADPTEPQDDEAISSRDQ